MSRSAFSHIRPPRTRREAQEPFAGDDKAGERERDRLFKQNFSKGLAASERLQKSIGIHNKDVWPMPNTCSLINSQTVETNKQKILGALSRHGGCSDHTDPVSHDEPSSASLQPRVEEKSLDQTAKVLSLEGRVSPAKKADLKPAQEILKEAEFGPVNGLLTEILCQASDLRVIPIPNLTFENIDSDMSAPDQPGQVLIRHLEVGQEGVEAIVHGQAYYGHHVDQDLGNPSSGLAPYMHQTAARNATGNLLDSCTCQPVTWTFFGILFGELSEEQNQIPSHWICLGVPEEATETCTAFESAEGAVDRQFLGGN